MKFFFLLLLISISLFSSNFSIQMRGQELTENSILITEIATSGNVDSVNNCKSDLNSKFNCSSDKWLEFHNFSAKTADLADFSLYFGTGKNTDLKKYFGKINLEGILQPGETIVISNKNSDIKSPINNIYKKYGLLQNISTNNENSTTTVNVMLKNIKTSKIIQDLDNKTFLLDGNFKKTIEFDLKSWDWNFTSETFIFKNNLNPADKMLATPGFLGVGQTIHVPDEKPTPETASIKVAAVIPAPISVINSNTALNQITKNIQEIPSKATFQAVNANPTINPIPITKNVPVANPALIQLAKTEKTQNIKEISKNWAPANLNQTNLQLNLQENSFFKVSNANYLPLNSNKIAINQILKSLIFIIVLTIIVYFFKRNILPNLTNITTLNFILLNVKGTI